MKLARVGNKNSHGRACYADGGRVEEDISDTGSLPSVTSGMRSDGVAGIDGGKAKPRLDRARKPASTTVNIVVASNKPEHPPAPPMPAMGGAPLPPPAMPAPGLPMRASGGRVCKADGGKVKGKAGSQSGEHLESPTMKSERKLQGAKGLVKTGLGAAIGYGGVASGSIPVALGGSWLATDGLDDLTNAMSPNIRDVYADKKRMERQGRKSGGRVNHSDAPEDKKMISKMVHKHEANMHKGKPETKFMKGGVVKASGQSDKTEKESMRAARATGGRVNVDAGAGGGLGRLEKAKDYGDKPAKGKK